MAQVVDFLSSKHKALSQNPTTYWATLLSYYQTVAVGPTSQIFKVPEQMLEL
jgi:cell shape-determining protein MreC